ncbi:hypothetical protein [Desulfoluna sp.]|uniref:hypothetical protein n=1 Tax=Desulfoluna sp. TaxID=2045199 RepID=UPI002614164B|nr:hypothetical protein [Desulfoluna sp.]
MSEKSNKLTDFGFRFEKGGAHTSRTMMLDELKILFEYVNNPEAGREDFFRAITEENCLGKRSGKTRALTYRHLVELYALDPSILLYRALVYFWNRDPSGQPLLALLCTYARDGVFRLTAPYILPIAEGTPVSREGLEEFIEVQQPDRFSAATRKSTAQNINATWTRAGHLTGRVKKSRVRALATAGSVSYALLLGYLTGVRGRSLFKTEYIRLLDCPQDRTIELAEEASRKGWITFHRVGDVMEVLFPNLINPQEMEWLRE